MIPEPAVDDRKVQAAMAVTALLVAAAAGAGIGMHATYGARIAVDEPQYLLTTLSLVEDGDLDISDELDSQVWRDFHAVDLPVQTERRSDGTQLSPHNPLLPVLLAPAVAVGAPLGVPAWVAAKAGLVLVAAALAAVTVWTAIRRLDVPPVAAAAMVTGFGAAPPLSIYATQLYPEIAAALAVTLAVAALSAPRPRVAHLLVGGLAVVALPWLAVKYVPVAIVLAAWLLLRARRVHRMGLRHVGVGLITSGVAYVVFHRVVYGGWTPYAAGDHFVAGELSAVGSDPDYLARSQRVLGLLVDRDFGLLGWQPAWALAVVGIGWALGWIRGGGRDDPTTATAAHLLVVWAPLVVAAGWATATWVALTMHGWWWPGRQTVVILPVLVLLITAWAGRDRRRAAVACGLGFVGVVAHLLVAWSTAWSDPLRNTLVVDFATTPNPARAVTTWLLPDLMSPSAGDGWRFAAWGVVAFATLVVGYHVCRADRISRSAVHPNVIDPQYSS